MQICHLVALGDVDKIIVGNVFASDDELKSIKEIIDFICGCM